MDMIIFRNIWLIINRSNEEEMIAGESIRECAVFVGV